MMRSLKLRMLKLGASCLLVAAMVTMLTGHPVLAAGCSTGIDATAGPASCTMTLNATNTGGTLTFSSSSDTVTATYTPSTHSSSFSFGSTLIDDRSSNSAGWTLQAASSGLVGPGVSNIVEPSFDSNAVTPTVIDGGTCVTPISTAITLSSTAATYLAAAASGGAPVNCSYAITTNGTVNFSGHIAGLYTGTLTITLQNT